MNSIASVVTGAGMTTSERLYLFLVLMVALLFTTLLGGRVADVWRVSLAEPSPQTPSAGQPRQVDMRAMEKQIQRGTLSDHEARYYRRVDEEETVGD